MDFGRLPAPEVIIAQILVFIIAITVHEFMHAWSAKLLGDTTAESQGRVTLNPVAHFDPLGFLFALLLVFGLAPIAWGRPVPVNTHRLRWGRRGMAIVAAAGPLSNLVMALLGPLAILLIGALVMPLVGRDSQLGIGLEGLFAALLTQMLLLNLSLFAFNLIPIPPLDGFNILSGILPNYWVPILEPIRQYSMIILILMISFGRPIIGFMVTPVIRAGLAAILPIVQTLDQSFGLFWLT